MRLDSLMSPRKLRLQDTSTRRPYSLTKEVAEALKAYEIAGQFSSEAAAIRSAIKLGLTAINNPKNEKA